jgi:hypothetical protein
MSEKKDILVNSPRGAGNVFCQHLMDLGLRINIKWGWHDTDKFEAGIPNIFILRNPYDSIAHALQTRAGEVKETFDANPEKFINEYIPTMVEDYLRFIDKANSSDFIKTVTFEFVTQHSDEFLHAIGKEFDIDVRPNRFTADQVIELMNSNHMVSDKTPREKSDDRKIIDTALKGSDLLKKAFDKYVEHKATIAVD